VRADAVPLALPARLFGRMGRMTAESIHRLELYPFSYFDVMRRRWIKARYVAKFQDIAERYDAFRIEGPPEIREGPRDSRIISENH
jgi:hypothetical protein